MIFFVTLITLNPFSFAQSDDVTLITKSNSMKDVIFDGKWTFDTEWKRSSAEIIDYDDYTKIYLRTAHYEDFLYVMINVPTDMTIDKNSDMATICFDPDNQRAKIATENNYCFSVGLGQTQGRTFQGGTDFINKGYMNQIQNFDGFIAIAKPSDENDRYNKIPHPTYEFRIPIDEIGRTDNYGFFFSVFDGSSKKFYTWPKDLRENALEIPSPQKWAMILSPDKSLPELPWNTVIFISFLMMIMILPFTTKFLKFYNFR